MVLTALSWALNPSADKPLESVTFGQCDTIDLRLPSQSQDVAAPVLNYAAW